MSRPRETKARKARELWYCWKCRSEAYVTCRSQHEVTLAREVLRKRGRAKKGRGK